MKNKKLIIGGCAIAIVVIILCIALACCGRPVDAPPDSGSVSRAVENGDSSDSASASMEEDDSTSATDGSNETSSTVASDDSGSDISVASSKPVATPTPKPVVVTPTPAPTPVPQPVVTPVPCYHGNGSDGGTCPGCGLSYSPSVDLNPDAGHDAGDLT